MSISGAKPSFFPTNIADSSFVKACVPDVRHLLINFEKLRKAINLQNPEPIIIEICVAIEKNIAEVANQDPSQTVTIKKIQNQIALYYNIRNLFGFTLSLNQYQTLQSQCWATLHNATIIFLQKISQHSAQCSYIIGQYYLVEKYLEDIQKIRKHVESNLKDDYVSQNTVPNSEIHLEEDSTVTLWLSQGLEALSEVFHMENGVLVSQEISVAQRRCYLEDLIKGDANIRFNDSPEISDMVQQLFRFWKCLAFRECERIELDGKISKKNKIFDEYQIFSQSLKNKLLNLYKGKSLQIFLETIVLVDDFVLMKTHSATLRFDKESSVFLKLPHNQIRLLNKIMIASTLSMKDEQKNYLLKEFILTGLGPLYSCYEAIKNGTEDFNARILSGLNNQDIAVGVEPLPNRNLEAYKNLYWALNALHEICSICNPDDTEFLVELECLRIEAFLNSQLIGVRDDFSDNMEYRVILNELFMLSGIAPIKPDHLARH